MPEVNRTPADRTYLSIREVLDLLVEEFPDVTISKIRFLESRGLIHPERTPSGYRKFYDTDVERLRWILRQQREHFLPLKVIKGRLDRENGEAEPETSEPSLFDTDIETAGNGVSERWAPSADAAVARPVEQVDPAVANAPRAPATAPAAPKTIAGAAPRTPSEPKPSSHQAGSAVGRRRSDRPPPSGISVAELAAAVGGSLALVAELEDYGLISSKVVGGVPSYDEEAVVIARLAAQFEHFGIEPRHLSALKRSAERQASLFGQVVAPLLRQRNPTARERAQQDLDEMAQLGHELESTFLALLLRDLTGH